MINSSFLCKSLLSCACRFISCIRIARLTATRIISPRASIRARSSFKNGPSSMTGFSSRYTTSRTQGCPSDAVISTDRDQGVFLNFPVFSCTVVYSKDASQISGYWNASGISRRTRRIASSRLSDVSPRMRVESRSNFCSFRRSIYCAASIFSFSSSPISALSNSSRPVNLIIYPLPMQLIKIYSDTTRNCNVPYRRSYTIRNNFMIKV
ncbi:MAG: hypothetical protein BWY45_02853 [Euryarchaeota archaeon ADurb.Bin294]|nr:MAG: hypothetical protein BWY45_02853 [Euryarchaeota archaeon ADurb.Bin294]